MSLSLTLLRRSWLSSGAGPGRASVRLGVTLLGIVLSGCGAASAVQRPTTAPRVEATPSPTVTSTFSATDLHLEGIAESLGLINACTVPIRCAAGAAALFDGVRSLIRTLDAQAPSLPHGVPSSFRADAEQLLSVATALESSYGSGNHPSSGDIQEANQVISTFNSDLSAGGLAPLSPALVPS